ncbi:MAG: metallophosphoesterase [Ruminococcaceae bacterium]|nr:metallophosphoesterase [Oscillospiraceae bacterium]
MKAIIFSDSHRSFSPMMKAMEIEKDIDLIIHAGDVLGDVEDLKIMYPKIPIAYVRGNNDYWDHTAADERVFEFGGVRIFLTHGHLYGVKGSLAKLYKKGLDTKAQICIFGHTHAAHCEKIGEVTLFNPGSAWRHYGILETDGEKFSLEIRDI